MGVQKHWMLFDVCNHARHWVPYSVWLHSYKESRHWDTLYVQSKYVTTLTNDFPISTPMVEQENQAVFWAKGWERDYTTRWQLITLKTFRQHVTSPETWYIHAFWVFVWQHQQLLPSHQIFHLLPHEISAWKYHVQNVSSTKLCGNSLL